MIGIVAALWVLVPAFALADGAGTATVIDGDTIEIGGERYLLDGIDAPESGQLCTLDGLPSPKRSSGFAQAGEPWSCGRDAADALAGRIGRRPVECRELGRDRSNRVVARCTVAGEDLGAWLLTNGWAVARHLHSYEYSRAEQHAKSARRGIWAGEFELPWEWRRQR